MNMQTNEETVTPSSESSENTTSARRRRNKLYSDKYEYSIKDLCNLIEHIAVTSGHVSIIGGSEISRELVARAIHALSDRSTELFTSVNCSDVSSEELASALFGLGKGAFTPAKSLGKGQIEIANKGTIFLNDISKMDAETQVKLLHMIEDGKFEKVGSNIKVNVDVRIISASEMKLDEMVEKGKFDPNLYSYLNAFSIEMPLLRRNAEDIPVLIHAITEKIKQGGVAGYTITDDAIKILSNFSWPGNMRELSNFIESLSLLYSPNSLASASESVKVKNTSNKASQGNTSEKNIVKSEATARFVHLPESGFNLKKHIAELEVKYIREALELSNGVVAQAAKLLGLKRTTLVEKLRKYGIQK